MIYKYEQLTKNDKEKEIMHYPPALVLAKNYAPVSVFPKLSLERGEDVIRKYLGGKIEVLEFYDRPVLSKGKPVEIPVIGTLLWPSVIVDPQKKIKSSIRLSNTTLYFRENGRCFWCNKETPLNKGTKDHIIPQALGGEDSWENLVFSCSPCNNEKGDSIPIGKWKPKYNVKKPTFQEIFDRRKDYLINIHDETWQKYLPGFASYNVTNGKDHSDE